MLVDRQPKLAIESEQDGAYTFLHGTVKFTTLMCELPDGEKIWSHIDQKMLDGLNRRRETGRGIPQWAYEEVEEKMK